MFLAKRSRERLSLLRATQPMSLTSWPPVCNAPYYTIFFLFSIRHRKIISLSFFCSTTQHQSHTVTGSHLVNQPVARGTVNQCLVLVSCRPSFPSGSAGKESACNVGDLGSIPGLGRSPGEGNSYPLQYSGLENSMDYIVHGVAKNWTRLNYFHFETQPEGWPPVAPNTVPRN